MKQPVFHGKFPKKNMVVFSWLSFSDGPPGEISQEEFVDGVLQLVVRDVPAETMRRLTATVRIP